MRFQSFDALRLFVVVAQHLSFTAAGHELNLTKGAVSYQIKQLEKALGFQLFERVHNGVTLTQRGEQLWATAQAAFGQIEQDITDMREVAPATITVGASTYFASRWLARRLMGFMSKHHEATLQLQPVIGVGDFQSDPIDMMVRWGKGNWSDVETELLFPCPAIATAGKQSASAIAAEGWQAILPTLTLLHDCDGSVAWRDWHHAAGVDYRPKSNPLVIHDPNVRVQAVISGQGVALNDALVSAEINTGQLIQIAPVELADYGYYLAYPRGALKNPMLRAFRDWIIAETRTPF